MMPVFQYDDFVLQRRAGAGTIVNRSSPARTRTSRGGEVSNRVNAAITV